MLDTEITEGLEAVQQVVADDKSDSNASENQQVAEKDKQFEAVLRSLLVPNAENKVNEEELFAAVIQSSIEENKGAEAAAEYQAALSSHKSSMQKPNGYIPVEDAARAALNDVVNSGTLTSAEGEQIHAQSFKAAQLDNNHDALYDGRGSADDPTIALADMEAALLQARTMIEEIEAGAEQAGPASLDTPSNSAPQQNTEEDSAVADGTTPTELGTGFVFKPESEGDGNLVILLPQEFTAGVDRVLLEDKDGNEVEEGRSTGVANGDREHFRFTKPGGEYPEELTVKVVLSNGETRTIDIIDPSERFEG